MQECIGEVTRYAIRADLPRGEGVVTVRTVAGRRHVTGGPRLQATQAYPAAFGRGIANVFRDNAAALAQAASVATHGQARPACLDGHLGQARPACLDGDLGQAQPACFDTDIGQARPACVEDQSAGIDLWDDAELPSTMSFLRTGPCKTVGASRRRAKGCRVFKCDAVMLGAIRRGVPR